MEYRCKQLDMHVLALPVRLGGLGLGNPSRESRHEYASSVKVTTFLVEHITSQTRQLPDESLIRSAQQAVKSERVEELKDTAERIRESAPPKTKRVLDLVTGKRVINVVDSPTSTRNGLRPEQAGVPRCY